MIFIKKTRKILSNVLIKFICYNLIIVLGLFLFNDVIIYHSSNLSKLYFNTYDKKYTTDDLYKLGEKIVDEMDKVIPTITFNKDGSIALPSNLEKLSINALKNISNKYPLLKGYYPDAKNVNDYPFSGYGKFPPAGVYFPYALEATYINSYSNYLPSTIIHEYAHLKGFRKEDEAELISIIAGINSNNDILKYSAYLSAYNYISNALSTLDERKYSILDEYYKSVTNSYIKIYDGYINSFKYNNLSNRYCVIGLTSFSKYKDPSVFKTFVTNLKSLVTNNNSIHVTYYLSNNDKLTYYDDIDINFLFNENNNSYFGIELLIDFKTINKNDYDNIYDLIYKNYSNLLYLGSMCTERNYYDSFQSYINWYMDMKSKNNDNDSDLDDIVSKKEIKEKYNFYMLPNTKENFFEPNSDDYSKVVRLLLEYYDNK
jgi:hypothetical protein